MYKQKEKKAPNFELDTKYVWGMGIYAHRCIQKEEELILELWQVLSF